MASSSKSEHRDSVVHSPIEIAILKTLLYSDIFDFPLTEEEIWRRLLKIKNQSFERSLDKKSHVKRIVKKIQKISTSEGFFFLKGRENIIQIRKQRMEWSEKKMRIARKVASYLRYIPTVTLIGISGGLASMNASEDDDIDLFIISANGSVWTTRLMTLLVVELLGNRRHPEDTKHTNAICLNMFVDEGHTAIPENERDVYSAHEVILMKPLFVRGDAYQRFINANGWVEEYLPNAAGSGKREAGSVKKMRNIIRWGVIPSVLENFFRVIQLWYMERRRTTETVEEGRLKFHPNDARGWVLKRFREKCDVIMSND